MRYLKQIFLSAAFFLVSASFIVAEAITETNPSKMGRSYYVSAGGNDTSNGLSEQTPFKTLAKAVDAASNSSVKRITVIGTLDSNTEVSALTHSFSDPDSVFCVDYTGQTEIVIGGIPGSQPPAESRGGDGKRVINIQGNSRIYFEHINITGGNTEAEGGGIFSTEGAEIILGEGVVISGNRSCEGGGVFVHSGSLIMLSNALIGDNSVSTDEGGGAVIYEGLFEMMNKSQISGNSGGGLILINSKGGMYDDAAITNNICEYDGGGVMVFMSEFSMRGNSRISENNAGSDGGGICAKLGKLLLFDGVSINGNNAGKDGGGVDLKDSSLILEGYAEVTGNKSGDDGGGIHCYGGYVILSEYSTILNNESVCGGGVCIENYASAIVRDKAVVSGNRALGNRGQGGGGLCAGYESNIHLLGGEVIDNFSSLGGGIYLERASLILDAGYVTNNHADVGGGIYTTADSFLKIRDNAFVKDNSPDNIDEN